jgi:hypothetical protein
MRQGQSLQTIIQYNKRFEVNVHRSIGTIKQFNYVLIPYIEKLLTSVINLYLINTEHYF